MVSGSVKHKKNIHSNEDIKTYYYNNPTGTVYKNGLRITI